MQLTITTLFTVIFALLTIGLSFQITLRRIALGNVAVGDGEDAVLRIRRETLRNFAEYVPLGLILLAVFESSFGSGTWTLVFALIFLLSRLVHIVGFQFMQSPRYFAPAMVLQHSYFSVASAMILYQMISGG